MKNILAEKGVSDEREVNIEGKQVWVWTGIEFSKGSNDSKGFSTLGQNERKPIDRNMGASLTSFAKSEEEKPIEVKEEKIK